MKFTRATTTLILLALLSAVPVANAAEKIRSQMDAFLVSTNNGKETLKQATTAEPGSILEYQLSYTNTTRESLSALNVAVPVPVNTRYLGKTAATRVPNTFAVSLDGGKTFEAEPVKRLRKNNEGKMVEVIVPPSEYTHLRWAVKRPLKGGEKQQFSYRIQVI